MTLLADVVAAAHAVAATTKRTAKRDALAELFAALDPAEVRIVVGFLLGEVHQGRIGIGWASIRGLDCPPADEPTLTVAEVDEAVDVLAATTGAGSQGARRTQLVRLLSRATAAEADFLGRLFVGEMRTGALAGITTDAVAAAARIAAPLLRRAVMLAGDLGRVAEVALTEGADAVAAIGLEPLRGVQPMLASTSESVAAAIAEVGEASVEWKLDGARIQVHREGDDVRIFTRNLNDVTARLPEVVEVVLGYESSSFVLDGEVLGFMGPDQGPQAFQDTMSTFGRGAGERALVPRFFDLLHLDGADQIDEPLRIRRARLADLVGPHLIPGTTTGDPAAGEAVLVDALAHGHEGVMVKAIDAGYEAGRRGRSWRKVKPVHTLDLVVLAVEWGSGRRSGWLSNIHLGALDPVTGDPVMVGKTFKGMTDEVLAWQTARFQELETHRSAHTVHVRPEQVVEVAIDGAQASTRYPGGVALRFARVVRYRDDKGPAEADTLDAVRALLPGGRS